MINRAPLLCLALLLSAASYTHILAMKKLTKTAKKLGNLTLSIKKSENGTSYVVQLENGIFDANNLYNFQNAFGIVEDKTQTFFDSFSPEVSREILKQFQVLIENDKTEAWYEIVDNFLEEDDDF